MDVAEPPAFERRHFLADGGYGAEEIGRLGNRHIEDIGDRLVLEFDFQRLTIVALAVALVAGDIDIRQKVHLDLENAVTLAGLATAALHIEREPPRLITAGFRFRQAREPVANGSESPGIGCRIGSWRSPDRRLVDVDDLVEMLQAVDAIMFGSLFAGSH